MNKDLKRATTQGLFWSFFERIGQQGIQFIISIILARRRQTDHDLGHPDRYVLFDVAPVLAGAEAISLSPLVDHILLVVETGRTSALDVKRALQLHLQEKTLGLVLNRHK